MNLASFGIYGKSGIGKTTLVVDIIKRLSKEGFKVVTIKITDKNIGMDTEEKDTWRYNKAGSELVVFSSPIETNFLHMKSFETNEILNYIRKLGEYDIVIIEGAHDKDIPKIRLGDITERENTILTYDGDFDRLIEMIKNEIPRR
jgi:molybdopterin-guanine dinucleotide biosynthesis protein B